MLLGLHERGIRHTLITFPPASLFFESGVLMPAARFDDGPWMLDSARILTALGFEAPTHDESRTLGAIFGASARERTDPPFRFWRLFSTVRDDDPRPLARLWNQLRRPFSTFYFFCLITFMRGRTKRATPDELGARVARVGTFLGLGLTCAFALTAIVASTGRRL